MAAGFVFNVFLPLRFLPDGAPRVVAGVVLTALSIGLGLWAALLMVKAGTTVEPYGATTRIITHGPFRYSRNPIYIALSGWYGGVAIAFNSLWPLLFLPVVLIVMVQGVIKREERYLERKFGEEYLGYKRRVRRWG